jgi:hypothetical protein
MSSSGSKLDLERCLGERAGGLAGGISYLGSAALLEH